MRRLIGVVAPSLLVLPLLVPTPASAQEADFLFGPPVLTLGVQGGWVLPGEGSDLFEFTRDQLTVEKGDFQSPALMVEAGLRLTERFDVAAGLEYATQTVDSESRRYVTLDDQPIPQSTEFSRTRLMGSLKGYVLPRGRRISRFAWVPNRWSPYIGGGVGYAWYQFRQVGDFVDEDTLDIFEGDLEADGSGVTAHALGGIEVSLTRRFLVRGEYRYVWGDGSVEGFDFSGFDEVDLSGSSLMLGVAVRL